MVNKHTYRRYHNQGLMVVALLFFLPLGLVLLWCSPRYTKTRKAIYTLVWLLLAVVTLPFSGLFWLGMIQTLNPSFSLFDATHTALPDDLGQEQSTQLTLFGVPDDYTIKFVYPDPARPAEGYRLDYWNYYGRGQGYVYSNGICCETLKLNPADKPKTASIRIHSPREYRKGVTWQEMLNEHGRQLYHDYPDDCTYRTIQDGHMLLGFDHGILVYVATHTIEQ